MLKTKCYVHGLWGLNMSLLVEDSSSIVKSSITLPISVSLLCHCGTNDMDCVGGRIDQSGLKGL